MKGLYGIANVGGCGSHGAKEATPWHDPRRITGHNYRWPLYAYTSAHAGVWFGPPRNPAVLADMGTGEGEHTVTLKYDIEAVANHKRKQKDDADTVTMVRDLVRYRMPGADGFEYRWKDTSSKSLSKSVYASAHTYSDPLTSWIPRSAHMGSGDASVQGLPYLPSSTGLEANYNSP